MKTVNLARIFLFKYAEEFEISNMTPEQATLILGLSGNFTAEDLKKSYKQKVLEFHPDRNQDKDTTTELKKINKAFEILKKYTVAENNNKKDISSGGSFDLLLDSRSINNFGNVIRHFNFGKYNLSIQGGEGKYSSPRENLPKLSQYQEFEIGILDNEKKTLVPLYSTDYDDEGNYQKNIVGPKDLIDMPHYNYWKSDETVAPYASKDEVKQIFDFFRGKFGLISEL